MRRCNLVWISMMTGLVFLVLWAWNSPFFWWFYDARTLQAPIFTRPIALYTRGVTVEGDLHERFHTVHEIMLSFDMGKEAHDTLRAKSGKIHLEFSSQNTVLQQFDIGADKIHLTGLTWDGAEIKLHYFNLPFPGTNGPVHFKLTVVEPIAFPGDVQPPACCLVESAYNP